MMQHMWSTFVQTPEELDASRALRFRPDNAAQWLNMMKLRDGQSILEIGCGSGLFTRRVKQALPACAITGLDRDEGHLTYARTAAEKQGLSIAYVAGDALALPFEDAAFDAVYAYTVSEHIETFGFLREQLRVLKRGGTIAVLSVFPRLGIGHDMPWADDGEEQALMQKARAGADDFDKRNGICAYPLTERELPMALEQAGFERVSIDVLSVMRYAPDSADVPDALAIAQINEARLSLHASVEKALAQTPDALTPDETTRLHALIDARFDKRLALYQRGEKLWDIASSTVVAATGCKP